MMKKAKPNLLRLIALSVACCLLMSQTVFAQTVSEEELYQWFLSRLPVWAVYGFGVGSITAWGWLRRIKYLPEELSIDRKVRKAFLRAFVLSVVLFVVSLWVDLWMVHEFETTSLSFMEALSETMRGWYWLALLALAALFFCIANMVFTQGAFSGRYALRPGPKRG
jgi:membrane protease YdiL (CAAX protease family)